MTTCWLKKQMDTWLKLNNNRLLHWLQLYYLFEEDHCDVVECHLQEDVPVLIDFDHMVIDVILVSEYYPQATLEIVVLQVFEG